VPGCQRSILSDPKRPGIGFKKSARMQRIESAIHQTAKLQAIKLLNRAWWREFFLENALHGSEIGLEK